MIGYDSGWISVSQSQVDFTHGLGAVPGHVLVMVQCTDSNSDYFNYIFFADGAAQNSQTNSLNPYGGLVFGYDGTKVPLSSFLFLFHFLFIFPF
jgi:hypothetical protein